MSSSPSPEVIRTLAAILMADVANYGQLMGDDEPQTVRTLQSYRQILVRQIESRRGRVLDAKGDAIMAEFASVVDAVAAAVEIQRELSAKNRDPAADRATQSRNGIKLEDIVSEEDGVYGDKVNFAVRLQTLDDPDGICLSRAVHDRFGARLSLDYECLGVSGRSPHEPGP